LIECKRSGGLQYKTFYSHNLQIFLISLSVSPLTSLSS
jgi:hypothetical protein